MIYLDYNATAPVCDPAREAWVEAQNKSWGNPSSMHRLGQMARMTFDRARSELAQVLGCRDVELVATASGSEANAMAIEAALAGTTECRAAASVIEHSSVLKNIEKRAGVECIDIPVSSAGVIDPAQVCELIDEQTKLVCVQLANNEIGTIQPIAEMVQGIKASYPNCLVLADCCQAFGKIPISVYELGVDFASFAGHKCGAPKGSALLFVKNGVKVPPLISGGSQQQDRRSGTEDVAALVAFSAAAQYYTTQMDAVSARLETLLKTCFATIQEALPDCVWNAQHAQRIPSVLSLSHPGITSKTIVTRLDLAGIAVSPGSACKAAKGEPSHVIAALGIHSDLALGTIRVSAGPQTSQAEIETFAQTYIREVQAIIE